MPPLSTCDMRTHRVPFYSSGSVKAQALQEVDKMLEKGALELVVNTKTRVLQSSFSGPKGVLGGGATSD